MTATGTRWGEVARRLKIRMAELDMNQTAVIRVSGVSPMTLRALLIGERSNYRYASLRQISRAVGWVPNAIEDLAESGKEPVEYVARRVSEELSVQHSPMPAIIESAIERAVYDWLTEHSDEFLDVIARHVENPIPRS